MINHTLGAIFTSFIVFMGLFTHSQPVAMPPVAQIHPILIHTTIKLPPMRVESPKEPEAPQVAVVSHATSLPEVSLPIINPNTAFMEVHGPEGTPIPPEVIKKIPTTPFEICMAAGGESCVSDQSYASNTGFQ